MKRPLIVITGPTAVGKTSLSISLAKAVNGEIISADSMQVYKKMDIGSAKIRPEEMQGVKHYLVDVLEPEEEFHIVKFQQMAKEAMEEIYEKGKIPILQRRSRKTLTVQSWKNWRKQKVLSIFMIG